MCRHSKHLIIWNALITGTLSTQKLKANKRALLKSVYQFLLSTSNISYKKLLNNNCIQFQDNCPLTLINSNFNLEKFMFYTSRSQPGAREHCSARITKNGAPVSYTHL